MSDDLAITSGGAIFRRLHKLGVDVVLVNSGTDFPPIIEGLAEADAIIIGSPTRFGSACAQVQTFLDATGGLWAKGALIGKVGSMFTSTATQHGGQESTLLSLSTFFYHQGMVIVGCPYSAQEQTILSEITGGSPYGATTITGAKGERQPSENEKKIARFQGKHVAEIATKLTKPAK